MARYEDDRVVTTDDRVVHSGGSAGMGTTLLTWLALGIATLALILAWVAYDRTGGALDERIRDATNNTVQTTKDATNNAADAIDKGPDGVDNDDTDTGTGGTNPAPAQ